MKPRVTSLIFKVYQGVLYSSSLVNPTATIYGVGRQRYTMFLLFVYGKYGEGRDFVNKDIFRQRGLKNNTTKTMVMLVFHYFHK